MASTCSTSDVPIPNASAPNAPCVAVWLSPHTMVIPGCVRPSSGPMTWTIPSRPIHVRRADAELFAVLLQRVELRARQRVGDWPATVGTLWSTVANDRSGDALAPASRRP